MLDELAVVFLKERADLALQHVLVLLLNMFLHITHLTESLLAPGYCAEVRLFASVGAKMVEKIVPFVGIWHPSYNRFKVFSYV